MDALEEALGRYGAPEIFNTTKVLSSPVKRLRAYCKASEVKISMDGKGRWIDNVFVERLWRSIK